MAKKRRKKRQSKDKKNNLFLFPILMVVAVAIIGVAYWKAPEDKKQRLHNSYSNAVETVKAKLEDRLAEISDEPEDHETDENIESSTSNRLFSYAGLPKPTTYLIRLPY